MGRKPIVQIQRTKEKARIVKDIAQGSFDFGVLVGTLTGALSILGLAWHTYGFGLSSTFDLLLRTYKSTVDIILKPLTLVVEPIVSQLANFVGFEIVLLDHWRYVLIVLWLYLGTHIRSSLRERGRRAALLNTALAIFFSVPAAVASGCIDLKNPSSAHFVAILPVAAIFAYGLGTSTRAALYFRPDGKSFLGSLLNYSRHAFRFLLAAILLAGINYLLYSQTGTLFLDGITQLFVMIVFISIYRIATGSYYANNDRKPDQLWSDRFKETGFGVVGVWMLATLVSSVVFAALNAGLLALE